MVFFLARSGGSLESLQPAHQLALYVAALCHDLEHPVGRIRTQITTILCVCVCVCAQPISFNLRDFLESKLIFSRNQFVGFSRVSSVLIRLIFPKNHN